MKKNEREDVLDCVIETSFKGKDLDNKGKDVDRKRKDLGSIIKKDVLNSCNELERRTDSYEKKEIIKECYQILQNDSIQSFASIISLLAVMVTIISIITEFDGTYKSIIKTAVIALFVILVLWKLDKISKENAQFRNNLLAINLLMYEENEVSLEPKIPSEQNEPKEQSNEKNEG